MLFLEIKSRVVASTKNSITVIRTKGSHRRRWRWDFDPRSFFPNPWDQENSVCSCTSVPRASSAFSAIALRNFLSSRGSSSALPTGLTILVAVIIRLDPTIKATGVIAHICAVGRPTRSISLVSVAPQRELVPQVEVRITPDIPSALSSSAIACPIFLIVSTILATPVVL